METYVWWQIFEFGCNLQGDLVKVVTLAVMIFSSVVSGFWSKWDMVKWKRQRYTINIVNNGDCVSVCGERMTVKLLCLRLPFFLWIIILMLLPLCIASGLSWVKGWWFEIKQEFWLTHVIQEGASNATNDFLSGFGEGNMFNFNQPVYISWRIEIFWLNFVMCVLYIYGHVSWEQPMLTKKPLNPGNRVEDIRRLTWILYEHSCAQNVLSCHEVWKHHFNEMVSCTMKLHVTISLWTFRQEF